MCGMVLQRVVVCSQSLAYHQTHKLVYMRTKEAPIISTNQSARKKEYETKAKTAKEARKTGGREEEKRTHTEVNLPASPPRV